MQEGEGSGNIEGGAKPYHNSKGRFTSGGTKGGLSVGNGSESGIIKTSWDNDLTPRGQITERISEDDLYDFVANELNISTERATEFTDAVMAYTDFGSNIYGEIRRFQRGEKTQFLDLDEVKKLSDDVEDYIKKAPRWNGGETFRGLAVSDDELKTFVQGKEVTMGGTSSWSTQINVSKDFAGRNLSHERTNSIIYHCQTQSKGTGIRHLSVIEIEDEVLCSESAKYSVTKIDTDSDKITHVYLKEV